MTIKNSRSAGFTLVELSIVLVIIGLIIGGVLSGRQIMLNAQITNTVNAIQGYEAQFQTYVQNYNALPGDDANALTRFPGSGLPAVLPATAGNGALDGTFDSGTAGTETRVLWAELRAAGLVKGAGSDTSPPTNPFGGTYGFQHGAFNAAITTNVLCLSNVPGDAAMAIDSRLDDGASGTGAVQAMDFTANATAGAAGAAAATYVSTDLYTLCVKM